jgi:cation:H+ antiporter
VPGPTESPRAGKTVPHHEAATSQAVLPSEGTSNAFIAGTGLIMTLIFVVGIVLRPQRRHFGLGVDSWVVLLAHGLGLWGLYVVSS